LTLAGFQLTGVEAGVPIIYNLSLTNSQLQFFIGGFMSTNGMQIETSSNLLAWETISTLPASTNQAVFQALVSPTATPSFYRVQNN
jgi:hypothetical protein